MTAHEFNNGDSRLLIDRSIQNDFTDSRRYISGSAAVAGGVVGYRKIVVNGFGTPIKTISSFAMAAYLDNLSVVSMESFPPM